MDGHGNRRLAATLASLVALSVATALVLLLTHGSQSASAGGTFAALARSADTTSIASEDEQLQELAANNPALDLEAARHVISDEDGTVWITTSTDGDICLLEKPDDAGTATSRFGCRSEADALTEGVVAGVPGHWYGVVPDGFAAPTATVGASTVGITVVDGAFRLPAGATAVTIAGTTFPLPG